MHSPLLTSIIEREALPVVDETTLDRLATDAAFSMVFFRVMPSASPRATMWP